MPLSFIRADIMRVECDAFAVPTDISLSGGGTVEASFFGACPELRLKAGLLIACIVRNNRIITPGGRDTLEPGDAVVVVTTQKNLENIRDILA